MDLLQKENLGNSTIVGINRRKGNEGVDTTKKVKTVIKPLCDVKNIIEDKINNKFHLGKNDGPAENMVSSTTEDFYNDELFFYSEQEDNYEDIIPKSLQLSENDVSQLVTVFERSQFKNVTVDSMEFLPIYEFDMLSEINVTEDCWDIIKGLDSTSLLFDDIEIRV